MARTRQLTRLVRARTKIYADVLGAVIVANHTMTTSSLSAFGHVAVNQGASVGDLARLRGLSLPAMSKLLTGLSARTRSGRLGPDLIERHKDLMDRRRTLVFLTDKGVALATRIHEISRGLVSPAAAAPSEAV